MVGASAQPAFVRSATRCQCELRGIRHPRSQNRSTRSRSRKPDLAPAAPRRVESDRCRDSALRSEPRRVAAASRASEKLSAQMVSGRRRIRRDERVQPKRRHRASPNRCGPHPVTINHPSTRKPLMSLTPCVEGAQPGRLVVVVPADRSGILARSKEYVVPDVSVNLSVEPSIARMVSAEDPAKGNSPTKFVG
jgi:hypothetical protein